MDFQELLAGYKTDQMLYVCLYMRDLTNKNISKRIVCFYVVTIGVVLM